MLSTDTPRLRIRRRSTRWLGAFVGASKRERKREKKNKQETHHVGVGRCRGDRRRRRPPPWGGGCRVGDDTNTRRSRDGSAPWQSSRARQIAHVHSTLFNPSVSAVLACKPTCPLSVWDSESTFCTLFRVAARLLPKRLRDARFPLARSPPKEKQEKTKGSLGKSITFVILFDNKRKKKWFDYRSNLGHLILCDPLAITRRVLFDVAIYHILREKN